ncbi:unnamed protein product [Ectocarpus sp. 4 AP-2014]
MSNPFLPAPPARVTGRSVTGLLVGGLKQSQRRQISQISRLQFFVGFALYVLHNACAWLYVRGCLPPAQWRPQQQQQPSWGGLGAEVGNHVMHVEILLPYVIGFLFGIGYGSVVAAGGWEALRVPADPGGTAGTTGSTGDRTGGGGGGGGEVPGGVGGGGGEETDISFAAQVCAWDSRAEEEAQAAGDGEEDDEDDFDSSSGPGSDNDDSGDAGENHPGGGGEKRAAAAAAAATSPSKEGAGTTARGGRVTRSRARNIGFKEVADSGSGEDTAGGGGASGSAPAALDPVGDTARASGPVRCDKPGSSTEGPGGSGGGSGSGGGGSNGGGTREPLRRLSLVHQPTRYDGTEAEDDEDDEEDGYGWGQQVVVKPVKVSLWDKRGQRSKALLSLNQLRACIIERAESTPQKATYHRAAKLGEVATVCLPVLFTLCTTVAYAWINAGAADGDGDGDGGGATASQSCETPPLVGPEEGESFEGECGVYYGGGAAACGRLRLEEFALAALWRAAAALWALASRALRPEAEDWAAAAVAVVSLCSVAFFAVPTFRALEDAERTYQRRYMYSKYFCALTSSQRARKHRIPHFSLKNVANIRVWLALRAGKTWLRRHRRERKADAVVSSAFFLSLALLAAILSEAISRESRFLSTVVHWELLVWCCFISFFLLRYLTLGSNTNNRYRDTSVLLTEQINVQLRILQNTSNKEASKKVMKRERLGVSTNVLKLATKLLKELDGPNKLSGLSMNPVLYNVTRVVLVSALSGVMSDTLGFSVKLWKVISFK